jgi:hypothetical protein
VGAELLVAAVSRQLPHSPQHIPWEQLVLQQATPVLPHVESDRQSALQNWLPSLSVAQYWPWVVQKTVPPRQPSNGAPSFKAQM